MSTISFLNVSLAKQTKKAPQFPRICFLRKMVNAKNVIIEFIGMPRAGKTTICKTLCDSYPEMQFFEEQFDRSRFKSEGVSYVFEHARFCIDRLQRVLESPGIHLFERGVVDRLAWGKPFFSIGYFSRNDLIRYRNLLTPHMHHNTLTIALNPTAEESLGRVQRRKRLITSQLQLLTYLHHAYEKLGEENEGIIFLPAEEPLDKLTTICIEMVSKHF